MGSVAYIVNIHHSVPATRAHVACDKSMSATVVSLFPSPSRPLWCEIFPRERASWSNRTERGSIGRIQQKERKGEQLFFAAPQRLVTRHFVLDLVLELYSDQHATYANRPTIRWLRYFSGSYNP